MAAPPRAVEMPKAAEEQPKAVPTPVAKAEDAKPAARPETAETSRTRQAKAETPKPKAEVAPDEAEATTETIRAAGSHQLGGLKILGKIELPVNNPRQGGGAAMPIRKKRKRIRGGRDGALGTTGQPNQAGAAKPARIVLRAKVTGDRPTAHRAIGRTADRNQAGGQRDGNRRDRELPARAIVRQHPLTGPVVMVQNQRLPILPTGVDRRVLIPITEQVPELVRCNRDREWPRPGW